MLSCAISDKDMLSDKDMVFGICFVNMYTRGLICKNYVN